MHLFGLVYYLSTAWNSPFQNAVFIGYDHHMFWLDGFGVRVQK